MMEAESENDIVKIKQDLAYMKEYKESLEEQVIEYHEKIDFLEKQLKIAEEGFKASESQVMGLHLELKEVSEQLAKFADGSVETPFRTGSVSKINKSEISLKPEQTEDIQAYIK